MLNSDEFLQARKDFLSYLRYTRGYSPSTCYAYNSDLGQWAAWLDEAGHDWTHVQHGHVEQWIAWQMRERGVQAHIISRRTSCLASFYKWAKKNERVENDPVYLADKPKKPQRIPIWLDREEQHLLEQAIARTDDLPDNIFGRKREHVKEIRQRYDILFRLMLNSGLRISEALGLKVQDVRLINGVAQSLRIIGKGNKERLVPLPESFGQVLGTWLQDKSREDYVFAKGSGQGAGKPPQAQTVRAYLRRVNERVHIPKKVTPHKLRHTYATRLLEAGAQLIDIQALLGHVDLATTQIYAHVSQDRMASIVAKL